MLIALILIGVFTAVIMGLYRYGKHVEAHPELSNVGRRMRAEYERQTRTLVDDVRHDAWTQFEASHQLAPTAVMFDDPYARGRRDAEAEMAGRERAAYDAGVRDAQMSARAQVEAARAQERETATAEFEARMSEIAERQEDEFTRVVEPHLEAAFIRGYEEAQARYVKPDGEMGVDAENTTTDPIDEAATAPYVSPVHWYTPGQPTPTVNLDADTDRWAHLRPEGGGPIPAHIALGPDRRARD